MEKVCKRRAIATDGCDFIVMGRSGRSLMGGCFYISKSMRIYAASRISEIRLGGVVATAEVGAILCLGSSSLL